MTYNVSFEAAMDYLRYNAAGPDPVRTMTEFAAAYVRAVADSRRAPYDEFLLSTGAKIKLGPAHPGDHGPRLVLAGYAADSSDLTELKRGGW